MHDIGRVYIKKCRNPYIRFDETIIIITIIIRESFIGV
jgi:hypothetical protein